MSLGDLIQVTFFMESENERLYRERWLNLNPLGHSLSLETTRIEGREKSSIATLFPLPLLGGRLVPMIQDVLHFCM